MLTKILDWLCSICAKWFILFAGAWSDSCLYNWQLPVYTWSLITSSCMDVAACEDGQLDSSQFTIFTDLLSRDVYSFSQLLYIWIPFSIPFVYESQIIYMFFYRSVSKKEWDILFFMFQNSNQFCSMLCLITIFFKIMTNVLPRSYKVNFSFREPFLKKNPKLFL